MERRTAIPWLVVLGLLLSSCRPGSTPTLAPESPAASSGLTDKSEAVRVIVMAMDGARPDWIASHIQNGNMPNLAALAQRGVAAAYMQAVDPTLAATDYLSLSTGAFPSHTGVVSDKYHGIQQAFHEPARLMAEPVVEPIWRTAMRHGLKTAVLFWPGASPDISASRADYVAVTAESQLPSAQHVITLQEAKDWHAAPHSFSPWREGTLRIMSNEGSTVAVFNVLAADSTDDGVANYDLLIVDTDKDLANGHAQMQLGQWANVTISPRLQSGATFCFTASGSVTATIYTSSVNYNQARPDGLLKALNAELGFPPPVPDVEALHNGWISPQQYYEMAERRAKWMMDATLLVYQTHQPELVLTAQSVIAECARAFLLVDEQQEGYTPERAAVYASYLQKAHKTADENLGHLLGVVNLARCVVFVVSGQGVIPVHTTVRLNTVLKNAGLLQLKVRDGVAQVDDNKSKALAFASGGSAHIYINLQGKERVGLVTPDDYAKVREQIVQALEETKDSDGQPVFARILTREELKSIHLNSPNSGDLFVQAAPGYSLSDALGLRKVLSPATDRATTGFDAALPAMHGIFVAAGDGIASGKTIPAVRVIDIAPTIARVLHMQPPDAIDGQAIEDIWR